MALVIGNADNLPETKPKSSLIEEVDHIRDRGEFLRMVDDF
jgi:hypothetical protein